MPISDYLSSNMIICICFLIWRRANMQKYFRWFFGTYKRKLSNLLSRLTKLYPISAGPVVHLNNACNLFRRLVLSQIWDLTMFQKHYYVTFKVQLLDKHEVQKQNNECHYLFLSVMSRARASKGQLNSE